MINIDCLKTIRFFYSITELKRLSKNWVDRIFIKRWLNGAFAFWEIKHASWNFWLVMRYRRLVIQLLRAGQNNLITGKANSGSLCSERIRMSSVLRRIWTGISKGNFLLDKLFGAYIHWTAFGKGKDQDFRRTIQFGVIFTLFLWRIEYIGVVGLSKQLTS